MPLLTELKLFGGDKLQRFRTYGAILMKHYVLNSMNERSGENFQNKYFQRMADKKTRVYFIRHTWTEENGPSSFLKQKGFFGIHYVSEPRSTNPKDYTGDAKRILEDLHNMDSEDLICSSFNEEFLEVGKIDKDFGIQLVDYKFPNEQTWCLKVAQHKLESKRKLFFSEFPMLLAAMPRQGTFGEWHLMREQILSIYRDGSVKYDYTALAPAQIEALCTSYLFHSRRLTCQSLPSGRTLKDIDIVGLDQNGERILAQVTFSTDKSKVRKKSDALGRYISLSPHLLFFAPNKMREQISNQEFISLETVWDYWAKESGGIFLKDFFGRNATGGVHQSVSL